MRRYFDENSLMIVRTSRAHRSRLEPEGEMDDIMSEDEAKEEESSNEGGPGQPAADPLHNLIILIDGEIHDGQQSRENSGYFMNAIGALTESAERWEFNSETANQQFSLWLFEPFEGSQVASFASLAGQGFWQALSRDPKWECLAGIEQMTFSMLASEGRVERTFSRRKPPCPLLGKCDPDLSLARMTLGRDKTKKS
jgi:hypothetical protein